MAVVNILDVAADCNLQIAQHTLGRVEAQAHCPFCGDKDYHLYLNTEKNVFMCQRCREKGSSVNLYSKITGMDEKTAFEELTNHPLINIISNPQSIPKILQYPLASLEQRHKVYLDFLGMLALSSKHKDDLLRRGLSNNIIMGNQYKTVPLNWGERYNIMYDLSAIHDLRGVPGFWFDQKTGQWRMTGNAGYFIPCCTKENLIQGMQIRLDNSSDKKFRWFSTSKNENGCGANGCSVHVVGNPDNGTLGIIEGFLKADIASYHLNGACFAAIAGINALKLLPEVVKELKPKKIIECGDMDKFKNPHVAEGVAKIKELLSPLCNEYISAKWNPQYNGLDDYTQAKRLTQKTISFNSTPSKQYLQVA